MSSIVASASPGYLEATGGGTVQVTVSVANVADVIDAYHLRVYGMDPAWVVAEPERLSLFPGDIGHVTLTISVPADYPAGMRQLSVHVQSENDPSLFSLATCTLHIASQLQISAALDPVSITGGSSAQFGLVIGNQGNATVEVGAEGIDPEERATFALAPPVLHLLPGEQKVVQATVTAKRPWLGTPKVRVLTFRAEPVGRSERPGRVEAVGTFVQRPRIGRWMLSLLGLMVAAAVFATVISHTLNRVVDEASVSDDIVNEALNDGPIAGRGVSVNPASLTGTVVSSLTGDGIAGLQAELYDADNGRIALASAATSTDGGFAFGGLSEGTYRLRFTGAGFADLWYPSGRVFTEGEEIAIEEGSPLELDPLTFGGRPGSVSGRVIADDPVGTRVSLLREGITDPTVPAVVGSVDVSADGTFTIVNVPSPATYTLVAERAGAAAETRTVVLPAGGTVDEIEIVLRPGDGVVSGRISAEGDGLGGVTVTATDGTVTISTVSLTEDSVGTYVVRNLATPGTYTITVDRDGYLPQTRTVSLAAAGTATVDWALEPATGSIAGEIFDTVDQPVGSATVTLTGGDLDLETRSLSAAGPAGPAGSYRFDGLPAPGTYTLTFSADGLVSQVRLVEVGGGSATVVDDVDVVMSRSLGLIRGSVRNVDGDLVAGSTIKLTNGVDTRTLLSAHEPLGAYAFSAVPPGTYTLTATLQGAAPEVSLVTITPGQVLTVDLQLGQQASLRGQVVGPDLVTPVSGVTVRLFLTSEFPSGVPVAVLQTDANGEFEFEEVDAPQNYIVAIYASPVAPAVLDSEFIASIPATEVTVLDMIYDP